MLHAIGGVIAPASGAVLFAGQTSGETDLPTLVAVLLGGFTAGSIHVGRASARPLSTATTGGLGNPVLSFAEDLGAAGLTAVAFLLPVLAVVLVVALAAGFVAGWRRLRRLRARRRGSVP